MYRLLVAVIIVTSLAVTKVRAEECTPLSYETLVLEARSADESREWDKSVELYRTMLADCPELLKGADLVKAYDALAVGLLMQENPSAAIDTALKCLELDAKYNACMMTAAQASYNLGDKDRAIGYAREAAGIVYDDYSNAVAIAAKDFLRKVGAK
jgi:tetratricopeptide (TPR) repeat protein